MAALLCFFRGALGTFNLLVKLWNREGHWLPAVIWKRCGKRHPKAERFPTLWKRKPNRTCCRKILDVLYLIQEHRQFQLKHGGETIYPVRLTRKQLKELYLSHSRRAVIHLMLVIWHPTWVCILACHGDSHGDTKVAHFLCRCPQFCGSLVFFVFGWDWCHSWNWLRLSWYWWKPGPGSFGSVVGAKSISFPLSTYSYQVEMLFQ